MTTSQFQDLLEKRSPWTPTCPTTTTFIPGIDQVMSRALAARKLEIPVGEFVSAATKRDLPVDDLGAQLLSINIADELVHDVALNNLATAYGKVSDENENEAQNILDGWLELEEHPISVARVIEAGVFFPILTLMRYSGDITARQVSADISKDEIRHVDTNWRVCNLLGITKCGKKANKMRRKTVAWIFEPLLDKDIQQQLDGVFPENLAKFTSYDFWMNQSDNLCHRGVAPELSMTRNSRYLAFFEISKVNQPNYEEQPVA